VSLIVEDGSIVAGAESYVSVTDADTYHSNRGNSAWTGTTAVKEGALRKATDYMLQQYRDRWQGLRVSHSQALDWPRSWAVVDGYAVSASIVPTEVKNACAEYALRALADDLLADQSQLVVRKKVGPLEVEYDRNAQQAKKYPAITGMLSPYFGIAPGMVRAVRA